MTEIKKCPSCGTELSVHWGEDGRTHLCRNCGFVVYSDEAFDLATDNAKLTARIVKLEEGLLTVKNIIVRWNSESDFDDGGLLELIEGVLK